MNYWLIKSEPECYSIDDLKRDRRANWTGIRNYQARNLLKEMKPQDLCLFYHSGGDDKGVYGIAKVAKEVSPDPTQFDRKDDHFDPKATKEKPIWFAPDIKFVSKFKKPIFLSYIKLDPKLEGVAVAKTGNRLSVQPVSKEHFEYIKKLGL